MTCTSVYRLPAWGPHGRSVLDGANSRPSWRMASGEQSHLKNAFAKGCDLHDSASSATTAAGVACNVTMAEALAVAAALELVLALRAMLLNVKTNVRCLCASSAPRTA